LQSLVVCALRSTPLVVLASWIAGVQAQDYPGKPIRWVIPYASGGAADITRHRLDGGNHRRHLNPHAARGHLLERLVRQSPCLRG